MGDGGQICIQSQLTVSNEGEGVSLKFQFQGRRTKGTSAVVFVFLGKMGWELGLQMSVKKITDKDSTAWSVTSIF